MLPNHIRRQYRFEVWQNPTSTQELKRLAFIEAPLRARYSAKEDQVETLSFSVGWNDGARALIKRHALIATQRLGGGDERMWRVTKVTEVDQANGERRVDVRCESWWADLGSGILRQATDWHTLLDFDFIYETPRTISELALAAYNGHVPFALGTTAPTEAVESLGVSHDSGLSLLRKLAKVVNGRLWFEWDHTERTYRIHLDDAAAPAMYSGHALMPGRQLVSLSAETDFTTSARNFYAKGASVGGVGLTLADAEWVVASVAGDQLTLVDDHGKRGPAPDDGWLLGYQVRKACTVPSLGAITACTGSLDGPTVLTIPGLSGLLAGDRVELLTKDGLARLPFLENPHAEESVATRDRVLSTETPYHSNKNLNPELAEWDEGAPLPAHLSELGIGATYQRVRRSEDDVNVRYGHSALRVIATAEGQGFQGAPFSWVKTDRMPVLTTVISATPISGEAQFYLASTTAVDGQGKPVKYPLNGKASIHGTLNEPTVVTISDVDIPTGEYRFCMESLGAAEWIFDAACVCPSVGNELRQISSGGGGQVLWLDAARVAFNESTPIVTYSVDLVHLYGLDPVKHADEQLEVGKRIRVYDPRLEIAVETKITEVEYSLGDVNFDGKIKLSNAREDVRDLLGGRRGPGGGTGVQDPARAVVKPTRFIERDPPPRGETILEFGIGKGKVLESGGFVQGFDPYFLRASEMPAEGWMPTATLKSTGENVPITAVARGADPFSWITFECEPFQASLDGDLLLITVPPLRGIFQGTTFPLPIKGAGTEIIVDPPECPPGYSKVVNPDGTWSCQQITFPDPLPVAGFDEAQDPDNPAVWTWTSTATPDPDTLTHTYTYELQ